MSLHARRKKMGKIRMIGYAEKTVEADGVKFKIEFFKTGNTLTECMNSVHEQSEEFLGKLKEAGLDISKIRIEDDDAGEVLYKEECKSRYKRSVSLNVKFDMKIENLIVKIIRENHYDVDLDTEYIFSEEKTIRNELMKQACEDSKNKAEIAAKAAGERIAEMVRADKDIRCWGLMEEESLMIPQFMSKNAAVENSDEISAKQKIIKEEIDIIWKTKKR